jgi:hypothetical protein
MVFESCPPRHRKHVREGVFLLLYEIGVNDSSR